MRNKSSKDQRFHSYLSPAAAKVYWRVRLNSARPPEAALIETFRILEASHQTRPEDVIMDAKGNPVGLAVV